MGFSLPSPKSLGRAAINPLKHAFSDESFLNAFVPPVPTAGPLTATPVAPANDPAAQVDRDNAALDVRRRAAGGRASTLLTSGLGESSRPSARRTLLGTV